MEGDRAGSSLVVHPPHSREPNNAGSLQDTRESPDIGSTRDSVRNGRKPAPPQVKIQALREILKADLYAADFKWSLFVAAAHSYRCDSCLHPFPPQYVKNGTKDLLGVRDTLALIPPFQTLVELLHEPDIYETRGPVIDILYWVLIELREPTIQRMDKSQFQKVLSLVPTECNFAIPNVIFKVSWSRNSRAEKRWKEHATRGKTFYAFHGSRLENFFSIINYGLLKSLGIKEQPALFGKGIYLSTELSMSLPYSTTGFAWGGSMLGCRLGCVALCELVHHTDLKCQTADGDLSRTVADDTIMGAVPPKYYLAQNSELVQLRYILVYTPNEPPAIRENDSSVIGWMRRNKLLTFLLGYAILLGSLGVTNSPTVQRYYRLLLKRWNL